VLSPLQNQSHHPNSGPSQKARIHPWFLPFHCTPIPTILWSPDSSIPDTELEEVCFSPSPLPPITSKKTWLSSAWIILIASGCSLWVYLFLPESLFIEQLEWSFKKINQIMLLCCLKLFLASQHTQNKICSLYPQSGSYHSPPSPNPVTFDSLQLPLWLVNTWLQFPPKSNCHRS
jgi:hypothetical protein